MKADSVMVVKAKSGITLRGIFGVSGLFGLLFFQTKNASETRAFSRVVWVGKTIIQFVQRRESRPSFPSLHKKSFGEGKIIWKKCTELHQSSAGQQHTKSYVVEDDYEEDHSRTVANKTQCLKIT